MKRIPKEYEHGKRQAAADVASGRLKLYWQTRASWGDLLARLMAERFGVVIEHVSDITNQSDISYRDGYNQTVAEHINRLFGAGSYQAVLDEVTQYRQEHYRRHLESHSSDQG